jgi:transposase
LPILAESVDLVVGVDPHKHTHTAAIIEARTGRRLGVHTVSACPSGFRELIQATDRHAGSRCWVVEGCGSWGRGLMAWLQAGAEDVREIDSPRRPKRRMGKKNDDLDAERTAREALGRDDLAQPRSTGERDAIAALLSARRSAIQMAADTERQLSALGTTCPESLAERLRGLKTYRLVTTCLRWRPTGDATTVTVAETMRAMARRIRELRAEAQTHEDRIEQLVAAWRPDLLELTGVGPIIAATTLTVWSHPGRIRNEAAFAMLAGAAPIPASSGLTTRHRLNRRGDRQLNSALHIIAIQRQRHDARTQTYFDRRRLEGKSDREIRRCLKRYIARELFQLLEHPLDSQ